MPIKPVDLTDRDHVPRRWRLALAFFFAGGAFFIFGSLITLLYQQTTPVTYAPHIHQAHNERTAKIPNPD